MVQILDRGPKSGPKSTVARNLDRGPRDLDPIFDLGKVKKIAESFL